MEMLVVINPLKHSRACSEPQTNVCFWPGAVVYRLCKTKRSRLQLPRNL